MLPLDEPTLTELRRRYEEAVDAETRSRYQMLLRSLRGQTSSQIAQIVQRSGRISTGDALSDVMLGSHLARS
jgi:hypothetical protein